MKNEITISGTILATPEFSHEYYGEKFYELYISTERKSGVADILKCVIPEMFIKDLNIGGKNKFVGEIRTRNYIEDDKSHLQVFVFVTEIAEYDGFDVNNVEVYGFIAKKPIYRKTPLGREITDVLIAHNGKYGKSSYIPTIVWGRNALKVAEMEVGKGINIKGRLQSRDYRKLVDSEYIGKVAYELSVATMEEVE